MGKNKQIRQFSKSMDKMLELQRYIYALQKANLHPFYEKQTLAGDEKAELFEAERPEFSSIVGNMDNAAYKFEHDRDMGERFSRVLNINAQLFAELQSMERRLAKLESSEQKKIEKIEKASHKYYKETKKYCDKEIEQMGKRLREHEEKIDNLSKIFIKFMRFYLKESNIDSMRDVEKILKKAKKYKVYGEKKKSGGGWDDRWLTASDL